jgi:hypothetical protein
MYMKIHFKAHKIEFITCNYDHVVLSDTCDYRFAAPPID